MPTVRERMDMGGSRRLDYSLPITAWWVAEHFADESAPTQAASQETIQEGVPPRDRPTSPDEQRCS